MKFKTTYTYPFLLLLCPIINSCTEPYILETNTYEEALVVEATITNELKKQEITLTKTSRFEDTAPQTEKGATVFITDNTGTRYDFKEESGKYISTTEFQASPGKEYKLNIDTNDGRSFESTTEKLPTINPMQDVKAVVEKKDSVRGVAIRVSSYDPTNTAKYYRYEYEETYKIIAPNWVSRKIAFNNGSWIFSPNSPDTKTCYSSKKNTTLLLNSTVNLTEDRVNYLLRFISDQNYIISHRYSIFVRQYIENLASYTYYKTLKKISDSGSLLSPTQPGILNGNIQSTNNKNNKIVGYFDIASVSTQRIYFNYADLFPGEFLPPYYTDCHSFCYDPSVPPPDPPKCERADGEVEALAYGQTTFFVDRRFDYGFLFWVNAPCGDCTTFSSNIKPPFWID